MGNLRVLLLYFFSLLNFLPSLSQNNFKPVKWDTIPAVEIALNPAFSGYDNVILKEKVLCSFSEADTGVMTIFIQYKINTEKGRDYFNSFCFPESFDPMSDYFGIPADMWKKITRPSCAECEILGLGARKIKKGNTEEIPFELIETEESIFTPVGKIKAGGLRYSFKNINAGDELQMYIRYKIPLEFFTVSSRRFFFNGRFPKQDYEIKFTNTLDDISVNFYQANNAAKYLEEFTTKYRPPYFKWSVKNTLPLLTDGCYRPSRELPFICFFFSGRGDYDNIRKRSWNYTLKKEMGKLMEIAPYIKETNEIAGVNYPSVSKFIGERLKEIPDTNRIERLNYIHNYIVKEFDFLTIREKIESGDTITGADMYFEKKIIYEGKKQSIYRELAKQTGNFLNYTELFDNRYEYYDTSNYIPVNSSHNCLVLAASQNALFYYVPKNSGGGYFANELPFYNENSNALINVVRNLKNGKVSCLLAKTPTSSVAENVRQIIYEAKIDSVFKRISFTGKLVLSGQFSTLSRDLYRKKSFNLTINPQYWKKPFPSVNFCFNKKENMVSQEEIFPFKTTVEIGFESEDLIKKNENSVSIDLTGIINHITWDNADLSDSVLSFYNDFRFKDVYRIKLQVPAGYKLSSENLPNLKIVNEFGKYEFKIIDLGNNLVLLESSFMSDVDFVPAQKKSAIAEIYKAIKTNRNVILKLQKIQ